MEFGTNASNPHYSDKYFYGYDTRQMNNLQDYVLFEPVSFPEDKYRAIFSRIEEITTDFNKPTFIVAYKQHIGIDSEYSQKDFDLLFTEAHEHKFNLCIKGSEYFTNNTWHNLDIEKYSKPQKVKHKPHGISTSPQITNQILTNSVSRKIIEYGQVPVMQFIAENRFGRYIANNLAKH